MTTWVLVLVILGRSPTMTTMSVQFASREACELAGRVRVSSQPRYHEYGWRCVEARRT